MNAPEPRTRIAYADESFHEDAGAGFYVLAAAVFDQGVHAEARAVMDALRGGRKIKKVHWNEMEPAERQHAAREVAQIDGFHVVTVGAPLTPRRQERGRAKCLEKLVWELHGHDVGQLRMEARTAALDRKDVQIVTAVRQNQLPKGTRFRVEHIAGADECLLWAADIVAGAVRADRQGRPAYRAILADCVYEIEAAID